MCVHTYTYLYLHQLASHLGSCPEISVVRCSGDGSFVRRLTRMSLSVTGGAGLKPHTRVRASDRRHPPSALVNQANIYISLSVTGKGGARGHAALWQPWPILDRAGPARPGHTPPSVMGEGGAQGHAAPAGSSCRPTASPLCPR